MSEKYVNYYIDTLVSTLTDCVVRNVSLQANAKVTDDVIQGQQKKIVDLEKQVEELVSSLKAEKDQKAASDNSIIQSLQSQLKQKNEEVDRLNMEINSIAGVRKEFETAKSQLSHLDNFRNEVVKARNEIKSLTDRYENQIKELNLKIENLQKTLKRKKQKETNQSAEVQVEGVENLEAQTDNSFTDTVNDGGSF